jgi:uncharacterized radical SAM protein YgiQ
MLPMTRAELNQLGWEQLDVLLISGDAYVDHPAFGPALLGRWLVEHGLRVGIIAQPRWDRSDDLLQLGRPALFAGITAGALDSMLAHYTAFRKRRRRDEYTPGGRMGARPNRACLVYSGLVRKAFAGLPVVLGGIEASLRRASHYDFWTDRLRRSILLDSKADLLIYGMAEQALLELASRLQRNQSARGIAGTAWADDLDAVPEGAKLAQLPDHEAIEQNPALLMQATLDLERQVHQGQQWLQQKAGGRSVVLAPPARPLNTEELERLYALPFTRRTHPGHGDPVPAERMMRFSVTTHRGCGGGCSFCSLALHQGRHVQSRSAGSLRAEVTRLTQDPRFKGSLSDVGGPSANLWGARCAREEGSCIRVSCLHPKICKNLRPAQAELADLLQQLSALPKVKHLRVASGVRHDLALGEPAYLEALVQQFVGGQLKVAPEHITDRVLALMRKPPASSFERFVTGFAAESAKAGKQQYLVPYLISAFPGCTEDDMRALASWLSQRGWRPQQVQCFIPTPGTVATAMYHAGVDPRGRPIVVARSDAERQRQHRLMSPARKR